MSESRSENPKGGPPAGPFRIANVAEITGVPEPTLRAWERRYGIPTPQRTASGYRLYGAEEVQQVREMRRLCEQGVAASEAAKLLLARRTPPAVNEAWTTENVDAYRATIDAILDAVTRFDDEAFEEQVRRMFLLGNAMQLFERLIAPVLTEIGDRWHAGELTVAQEHFASHKLGTLLRDLVRLSPGTSAADCAVFASFEDEEHELGLLGFALRVSEWGLRPIFLGARTPPAALRSAVRAVSPRLVALSISAALSTARARELVRDYAAACEGVPWVVGGGGAAALAELVEKHGGKIAPEKLDELRALVHPRGEARGDVRKKKRKSR